MSEAMKKVSVIPQEEPTALAIVTPMEMLSRAVQSGADIDMIEKLMGLQERWEANQARKAFDNAMASAKAKIPVIRKNRRVGFEHKSGNDRTEYNHEDMAEIARTVDPILSEFGLSYRFRVLSDLNQPVRVTCIISHRDGHSEETTLSAGRDDSGKKNALQQIGSTITYLQRYTLKAALGLAAADDDDGKASTASEEPYMAPPGSITQDQAAQIRDLLESLNVNTRAFLAWAKQKRVEDIPAEYFDSCISEIKRVGKAK